MDTGLIEYMSYFTALPHQSEVQISSEELNAAKEIQWSGQGAYETLPGTGYYFPLIYLPQAIALSVGELLGQSVDSSYKLARGFSLGVGTLLLFAAFRTTAPPALVIALLFLPMTLFQAASASIDFLSTAMLLLITALYFDMMKEKEQPGLRTLFAMSALIFLLAGCRLHMAPLVLFPFTLGVRFRNAHAILLFVILCIAIILWYGFALTTTEDMRVNLGATPSQIIQYYLHNPLQFLDALWATLSDGKHTLYYLHSFLGILGWLDVPFTSLTYTILYTFILLILLLAILQGRINDKFISLAVIVSAFSAVFIVFFSLLVTWTPHPASTILGVQGRYFLLPCLLLVSLFETGKTVEGRARKLQTTENFLLILLFSFSVFATADALEARYFLADEL